MRTVQSFTGEASASGHEARPFPGLREGEL
jgi:hypothetical protein